MSVYYLLILAVGIERLVELAVSTRNARWAFAHGGTEFGRSHYPVMVAVHTAMLVGCVVEVWALHRPFLAWLGWPMALLSIFLGASVAAVVGLGLILARRARWGARIPFGPYLALGSLLCLFWGRAIMAWYLGWYIK